MWHNDLATLLVVYLALQLTDYVTTLRALEAGGREANPAVLRLMEKFGTKIGLGIAKLFGVGAGVVLYYYESELALGGLIVLYGAVVINNYYLGKKNG